MGVKVTVQGVTYAADTAAEALEIIQALTDQKRATTVRSLDRYPTLAHFIFRGDGQFRAYRNLADAAGIGVTTLELLAGTGISPKSLPPMTAAWRRRGRQVDFDLDGNLLVKRAFVDDKPATRYVLTPEAADALAKPYDETK